MIEADWQASSNPEAMLEFLQKTGNVSERKLRLFGCASCRTIWQRFLDPRNTRAVEVAEGYADGLASQADADFAAEESAEVIRSGSGPAVEMAWRAATAADHLLPDESRHLSLVWTYVACVKECEQLLAEGASDEMIDHWSEVSIGSGLPMGWTTLDVEAPLAILLREVVGPLPFRSVTVNPWLTTQVTSLAEAAYQERTLPEGTLDKSRLGILADALEEQGCKDADILGHLRGPGPHVRGCFALDLVLRKS